MRKRTHNYHLVENSPWPIYVSINILSIIISIIMIIYNKTLEYTYYLTYPFWNIHIPTTSVMGGSGMGVGRVVLGGKEILILSGIGISISIYNWVKEIIKESTYEGNHTKKVQKGITIGFILVIISEICIFVTLFFAYFYNSLIPSVEISAIYPPIGIEIINPKALPLLNTIILFISGITATYSLNMLICNERKYSIVYLIITIILGIVFSYFQYIEYKNASFTITDSIFGSSFYTLTGFHGVHVIMGIIFLIIALIRLTRNHLTTDHFLNLSNANIYWHFVDYVWIILYVFIYSFPTLS